MTDRTVRVRLEATVAGFNAAMDSARSRVQGVSTEIEGKSKSQSAALEGIGKTAAIAGAAVFAGLGFAARASMGFEQQLSNLKAASGANAASMDQLRQAALSTGRDTMFSASQAADAETALAKAGVSTADILGGALTGTVALAAAGQLQLADAAEIASGAMTQFGLSGKDVGHVADLLAAGAGKAQGEVSDMALALRQSGLVAAQSGLSIEETTGALAAFASNSLLGSDAGTSFKTMLQRLNPQSQQAADLMKQLGLSAYDQSGKFIGLANYAGKLQTALQGMSQEQRAATMQTLFGSDSVRAAAVLYKLGAAGVQDWINQVNDSGYAARYAATANDNLAGDLRQLKGSIETALIATGSQANGVLRFMAQEATGAVNAYAGMPGPLQAVGTGLAVVTGATLLFGGAAAFAVNKTATFKASLVALNVQATTVERTMTLLTMTMRAGALGAAVVGTALAIDQLVKALAKSPPGVNNLVNGLVDFTRTGRTSGDLAKVLGGDFENLASTIDRANKTKYLGFSGAGGPQGIEAARKQLDALDQALAALVQGGHADVAAKAWAEMQSALMGTGVSVDDLKRRFPGYAEALAGATAETKLNADATGKAAEKQRTFADAATDVVNALKAEYDPVFAMSQALAQHAQAQLDAATAVKEHGAKSKEAQQAQIDLLQSTVGLQSASANLTGAISQGTVSMAGMTAQLGEWVKSGLITQAQAQALTGQLGGLTKQAETLDGIDPQVYVTTNAPAAGASVDEIDRKLRALDGRSATVTVNILEVGAGKLSPAVLGKATGGVVDYYATGGVREDHVAQIAPAGSYRVWAEPETGGEAYIPLAASKRGRSTAVWAETGRRLGVLDTAQQRDAPVLGGVTFSGNVYVVDPDQFARQTVARQRDALAVAGIST